MQPACIDLFADADLCTIAPAIRCNPAEFPQSIPDLLEGLPRVPVIYTGGLENYPKLVQRISEARPLWGNDAAALSRCRCPFTVAKLLQGARLSAPAVHSRIAELTGSRRWLRKPLAGSAGFGIQFVEPGMHDDERFFYQEFIAGTSMSASYVALPDETLLIGVTEQLIGEPWLHAPAFRYCGNIGPVPIASTVRDTLIRMGEVIASSCGLRGLFGIDFILHDETPMLVEVNPRYTASMEVLERSTGMPCIAMHRAAFEPVERRWPVRIEWHGDLVGKAILYTSSTLRFPKNGLWLKSIEDVSKGILSSDFADIPKEGEEIEAGWPVMTYFIAGNNAHECRNNLRERAKQLKAIFHSSCLLENQYF